MNFASINKIWNKFRKKNFLFPSSGNLPNAVIEPRSPASQADYLPTELQGKSVNKALWKWKSLSGVLLFATPRTYTAHGILQARILEGVAFLFFRGSS